MSDGSGGPVRGDDDLPPSGESARAERRARVMPLVWLGLGAVAALVFALLLIGGSGFLHGRSAGPAPTPAPSPPSLASGAQPR